MPRVEILKQKLFRNQADVNPAVVAVSLFYECCVVGHDDARLRNLRLLRLQ